MISIVSNLRRLNAMLFPGDVTDEWLSVINVGLVTDRVSEEGNAIGCVRLSVCFQSIF